jgi:hypothetical protein
MSAVATALVAVVGFVGVGAASALFPNDHAAFDFFVAQGLTQVQAAGIVGNLDQESGVNPTSIQSGCGTSCGEGIAQWTIGGRWDTTPNDNVVAFAASHGEAASDLTTQLQFIWYELTTFPGDGLAPLRGATDVTTATQVFETDFEGCGACNEPARIAYANAVLAAYGTSSPPPPVWSGWSSIGAATNVALAGTGPSAVLSPGQGAERVFITGTNHALYEAETTPPGGGFSSGFVKVAIPGTSPTLTSSPTAINVSSSETDVFVTGNDTTGASHVYVTSYQGGTWSSWLALGAGAVTTKYAPAVVLGSDSATKEVFITGSDGALYQLNRPAGGSWEHEFTQVIGPGHGDSAPAALRVSSSEVDVFVKGNGTGARVYIARYATGQGWSSWTPLGAAGDVTDVGPGAVISPSQNEDVFMVTPGGTLKEISRPADLSAGWQPQFATPPVTGSTGTPTGLVGYTSSSGTELDVFATQAGGTNALHPREASYKVSS